MANILQELDFSDKYLPHFKARSKDSQNNPSESSAYIIITLPPPFSNQNMASLWSYYVYDSSNDFSVRAQPPVIIPVPPIDIIKLCFGADSANLYIKAQVNAIIPAAYQIIQGQIVKEISIVFCIDADTNTQTGWGVEGVGTECMAVFYHTFDGKPQSALHYNYFGGPSGDEFDFSNVETLPYTDGGSSTDYYIMQIPLIVLGITEDRFIRIRSWAECPSYESLDSQEEFYHHYSMDWIGDIPFFVYVDLP
ncbi:MAG: hypothetical protein A2252_01695 [Elusimicrobia bacterium RIFOXYA2_FULL_39_19]|nr:MAG: hypothetical protein A2252_01695 [Elusimicrobia bacterium RIFOXYA2_FULL_39_19]